MSTRAAAEPERVGHRVSPDSAPEESVGSRQRRRWVLSARMRILVWYVVLLAIALLIAALAVRQVLLNDVNQRIDSELSESAAALAALGSPAADGGDDKSHGLPSLLAAGVQNGVPEQNATVIALLNGRPYSSSGSVPVQLTRDASLVDQWSSVSRPTFGSEATSAGEIRYAAIPLTLPGSPDHGVLVTAIFAGRDRAEVTGAVNLMVVAMAAALVAASCLAWFAAGRVLRPVRRVTSLAQSITDSDLRARIPVTSRDEIGELARTFNGMLDRLDRAFQSQRAFIDDAGHELRTPITIIRGQIDVLGDDPREHPETMAIVSDELDRMSRQVDELLMLAKAAQPAFLHLSTVNVHDLTDQVFAKVQALGERAWKLDNSARARVVLDPQRITQALVQLATNAVQHTHDGDRIELGSAVRGGSVRLWVADSGPGIAAADQERIFDRFTRTPGGQRRGNGAGLGLAIVRSIATAHHGRIEVASSLGEGATFTLTLPIDQPLQQRSAQR